MDGIIIIWFYLTGYLFIGLLLVKLVNLKHILKLLFVNNSMFRNATFSQISNLGPFWFDTQPSLSVEKFTYKQLPQKNVWEHTHTHTMHSCAHLFEDPTNLSNSALGMLLMGDGGRGWWKCLHPGRIDRLAAPNERQACLRNHEGHAVGLQRRS